MIMHINRSEFRPLISQRDVFRGTRNSNGQVQFPVPILMQVNRTESYQHFVWFLGKSVHTMDYLFKKKKMVRNMGFKLKNSGLEIKLDGYPIGDPGGEITQDHHVLEEEEEPTKHSEAEWAEVREVRGRWEGKGTSAGSSATL